MNPAAVDPNDAKHTVSAPLTSGFVIVSNGRHRTAAGLLWGAPPERCVLNDPDFVSAEYVYPDRQSAEQEVRSKAIRWGLAAFRRPTVEFVPVTVVPLPQRTYGPALAIANAHSYAPPSSPTIPSRQFGMLWADAQWAGLETQLAMPPPAGSENRWCCVFLGRGLNVQTVTGP